MKYFMIGALHLRGDGKRWVGVRRVHIGEVIEFDGTPGAGMVAVDAAAFEAKARAKNDPHYDALKEQRLRLGLDETMRARLAACEYHPGAAA